jgi:hypothetical protein
MNTSELVVCFYRCGETDILHTLQVRSIGRAQKFLSIRFCEVEFIVGFYSDRLIQGWKHKVVEFLRRLAEAVSISSGGELEWLGNSLGAFRLAIPYQ